MGVRKWTLDVLADGQMNTSPLFFQPEIPKLPAVDEEEEDYDDDEDEETYSAHAHALRASVNLQLSGGININIERRLHRSKMASP